MNVIHDAKNDPIVKVSSQELPKSSQFNLKDRVLLTLSFSYYRAGFAPKAKSQIS